MKVTTVVGTRPELIRLSRLIPRLDATFDHRLIHTGQNYDPKLNEIIFDDLGIRPPDDYLGVDTSSLGRQLGETLIRVEESLKADEPDAVLILGDTNSAIAALMARRMNIPVYHMEAGNRCFDENVPEEINRRFVDHIADFNLVYTEHARRNLLAEGLHPRRILLTGSPMGEVLHHYREQIEESDVLSRLALEGGRYFLVSAHRQENVDSPSRLQDLIDALEALQSRWDFPVVVSTHPRTRARLESSGSTASRVLWMPPFGFHDYNKLQLNAACVLSDSGTISEESAILGFPAITLRDSMERPEALDAGGMIMTGLTKGEVLAGVSEAIDGRSFPRQIPAEYSVRNTSERVVRFIRSTAPRHREWAGLRHDARS